MNNTPPRPQHPSYLLHRKQVAWQIIVPVAVAGLVLIVAAVLLWRATIQGNGPVNIWAAIAAMWLTIPFLIGGLVMLAALIGIAYGLGFVRRFIPRYTWRAQEIAKRVEAGSKQVERIGHKPVLIFPEIGGLVRRGFRRMRGR